MKGATLEGHELPSPLDTCSLDFFSEFIQFTRGLLKLLARTTHSTQPLTQYMAATTHA